jgi:hypothetical protein
MSFSDRISAIAAKILSNIAPIVVGAVVSFDSKTHTATIKTTHQSGKGSDFYELPWPSATGGIFSHDPVVETKSHPGTHVVIGFRGFDWNYPVVLTAYDPFYPVNTRVKHRRELKSWNTRGDKVLIGKG